MKKSLVLGASVALLSGLALAENPKPVPDYEAVSSSLKQALPNLEIQRITESPIPGLFEVQSNIARLLYVSADGRYFVAGDLYEIEDGRVSNPAQERMQKFRIQALSELDEKDIIAFKPEGRPVETTITVFTDVDCGYCQKLHLEVDRLNEMGIQVNYLAFPRGGLSGVTYDKMVSIWCAEDRQEAMTRAKSRLANPPAVCENPVDKEYELGNRLGVTGTPAIVLSNGQLVPGYLPADELARRLGLGSSQAGG